VTNKGKNDIEEKKVLIGCPTYSKYEYCVNRYIESVRNLDYNNYDILLVDNSSDDSFYNELKVRGINVEKIEYSEFARDRIVRSRNLLRQRAIEGNYDYLFSLEQDIIVKPHVLSRLLSHHKKIVSAYYTKRMNVTIKYENTGETVKVIMDVPVFYIPADNGKIKRATEQDVLNKGLIQVGNMGLGCILIAREVFTKIKFRYDPAKIAFDDMYFGLDAKILGYKLHLDSDTIVEHDDRVEWNGIRR
jgi:GT2 family glycosyltransferase